MKLSAASARLCYNPFLAYSKLVSADNLCKLVDTLIVFLKEVFEKVNFVEKSTDDNKSMKNYPACKKSKSEVSCLGQTK